MNFFNYIMKLINDITYPKLLDTFMSGYDYINKIDGANKTTIMSYLIDDAIMKAAANFGIDLEFHGNKTGYDYLINEELVELKTTRKKDSGFTGHKYTKDKKSPLLILIKYDYDKKGINELYAATVDMAPTVNSWNYKQGTDNSGFSTLKFDVKYFNIINVIYGNLKKNKKWCKEIPKKIESHNIYLSECDTHWKSEFDSNVKDFFSLWSKNVN